MPKYFRKQDYYAIKGKCFRAGVLWEDDEFPANTKSLYYSKIDNVVEWRRPKELCKAPKLIWDKPTIDDLQVGENNNHWFVSACVSITKAKDVWAKLIPDHVNQQFQGPSVKYAGIFRFDIFRFGEWISVCVDDRLPCRDGRLIFVHSLYSHEYWTALLEKAYAKLFGDYESLSHGDAISTLIDFTGGVGERVDIYTLDMEDEYTFDRLFDKMEDSHYWGAFQIARLDCHPDDAGLQGFSGLMIGHWYVITDVVDLEVTPGLQDVVGGRRLKMIRLFNPCIQGNDYVGPWSNGAPEWEIAAQEEWEKMGITYVLESEFWMPFSDFTAHFTNLDILHRINLRRWSCRKKWKETVFHSQWSGNGRNGGGDYEGPTILANPQFSFDVMPEADRVFACIDQYDMTGRVALHGALNNIGFHIMKVEDNRIVRAHVATDRWFSSDYQEIRAVFGSVKLSKGRYVILATTYLFGQEGQFMLRLYTGVKTRAVELTQDVPKVGCCQSNYKIVTVIKVLRCTGLQVPAEIKSCNPKLILHCEGQKVISAIQHDTTSPEYTVSAIFYRRKPAQGIAIEVWHEKWPFPKFIAQGLFLDAAPPEGQEFTLELVGKGKEESLKKGGTMDVWAQSASDMTVL